jgi:hypothetical protein
MPGTREATFLARLTVGRRWESQARMPPIEVKPEKAETLAGLFISEPLGLTVPDCRRRRFDRLCTSSKPVATAQGRRWTHVQVD